MSKVILCGYVIIPAHELDMLKIAMKEQIRLTLAEPGCLEFTLTPDPTDPCRYSLYEEFVDQAAFDFHQFRTRNSKWHTVSKNIERHFDIIAA